MSLLTRAFFAFHFRINYTDFDNTGMYRYAIPVRATYCTTVGTLVVGINIVSVSVLQYQYQYP